MSRSVSVWYMVELIVSIIIFDFPKDFHIVFTETIKEIFKGFFIKLRTKLELSALRWMGRMYSY